MATIYNSSFYCNRIQIYETRLNFDCLYNCLQDLFTVAQYWVDVLLGALLLKTVQEISPFRNKKELNELLSWLPWKYFFPLWGSQVDRNMKALCILIARQGDQ